MAIIRVSESEWAARNQLIAELFELHRALRMADRLIFQPETLTEDEADEIRKHLHHVKRDFLPDLWTHTDT